MPLPPLNVPLTWKGPDPNVAALLDDLQANILKGHGRDHSINLFLKFDPTKAAAIKAAIHQLSGDLKTAKQQLVQAEEFKSTKKDGGAVRCFMLTFEGYKALGVQAKAPAGVAFQAGMKSRQGLLKDTLQATWDPHFQQTIHALLLLADVNFDRLEGERDSVVAALQAVGVTVLGGLAMVLVGAAGHSFRALSAPLYTPPGRQGRGRTS